MDEQFTGKDEPWSGRVVGRPPFKQFDGVTVLFYEKQTFAKYIDECEVTYIPRRVLLSDKTYKQLSTYHRS